MRSSIYITVYIKSYVYIVLTHLKAWCQGVVKVEVEVREGC